MNSSSFIIEGGRPLNGRIKSSGAKNAALKMIAAAALTDQDVILKNIPLINDVLTMLDILKDMAVTVEWLSEHDVKINASAIDPDKIDQNKIGNLRGSVVLIGPLIARFNKIVIHEPGGCSIGSRPITTHIHAFEKMGVNVSKEGKYYTFTRTDLVGTRILLDEISWTATENILMAATLAQGTTQIHLAATEPEIGNLIDLLESMGAVISGRDTNTLHIEGKNSLTGGEATIIPDRLEIGTFAIAIAASHGNGIIDDVIPNHLDNLLNRFDQMNIEYHFKKPLGDGNELNSLTIKKSDLIKAISFDTRPYPGFSTDFQSPMVTLLTQATGQSYVFETLFEGRLGYVKMLKEMGADIEIVDNRTIVITGPTKLKAMVIDSHDLRAGAALAIAGLIANGKTEVKKAQIIDRGYEDFSKKLSELGATIERIS